MFDPRSDIVSGVYSWGKVTKLLLLNLVVVFEACRIKGVTQLRAAEAAKQPVIRVRRRKISAHSDSISLQGEQCTNKL